MFMRLVKKNSYYHGAGQICVLLFLLSVLPVWGEGRSEGPRAIGAAWVYELEGEFEDVRDNLVDAIESEGMVISYISHAQAMLSRTAPTIENPANVYRDAEVVLFCKADLAHMLIAAGPHNLVLCPYAVAVYTLREESKRVYIAIRKPDPDVPEFDQVHRLLLGLIATTREG